MVQQQYFEYKGSTENDKALNREHEEEEETELGEAMEIVNLGPGA